MSGSAAAAIDPKRKLSAFAIRRQDGLHRREKGVMKYDHLGIPTGTSAVSDVV
jgi:hypothetical protein